MTITVALSGLMVTDQEKALEFYTDKLGLKKVEDIPVGEYRWITVAAQNGDGAELSLEPNAFPPAKTYQKALYDAGIPATALKCEGLDAEIARLEAEGVVITSPIAESGPVRLAVIDDGCGNLIQLFEPQDSSG